jgi:hypothetical protein
MSSNNNSAGSGGNNSATVTNTPGNEWVQAGRDEDFNANDYNISNLRILDEETQKGLLFKALRGI